MALAGMPFSSLAESVAHRAADLLAASVVVVDEHDELIARARPPGSVAAYPWPSAPFERLRIPVRIQGRSAEIIAAGFGEAISPRLAQALVDLVVSQADVVAQMPSQDDLRSKLLRDLLAGDVREEGGVVREAQILGMDLSRPRAVMLVDAGAYILASSETAERHGETTIQRRAREVINHIVRFFHLPSAAICTYLGDGEVAILKASASRDLAAWSAEVGTNDLPSASWANLPAQKRAGRELAGWLRKQIRSEVAIGIGRHHAGLAGLARSGQDARSALSLGRRLGLVDHVYCLDDLGAAAFVGISDQRTRLELAVRLLSPLEPEPDLLMTLVAYFEENCCPSATAKRMAIHRNTLSYRLDKVTSLTGLDPRRFDDAVQMRLALLLRAVCPEAEPTVSGAGPA